MSKVMAEKPKVKPAGEEDFPPRVYDPKTGKEIPPKVYDSESGEEVPTHQFAVRFNLQEQIRYARALLIAQGRNKLATKTHVNRELMGLQRYGLFTDEEIEEFRGSAEPPAILVNVPDSSEIKEAKTHAKGSKRARKKE
jgi:hypothetical protein